MFRFRGYQAFRYTPSVLAYFCSQCADVASSKGHSGTLYAVVSGLLTAGLGIGAAVAGFLLMGYENGVIWCFFLFIGGAVAGFAVSWLIVLSLDKIVETPRRNPFESYYMPRSPVSGQVLGNPGPIWCIRCGRQLPESKACDRCGAKVPTLE